MNSGGCSLIGKTSDLYSEVAGSRPVGHPNSIGKHSRYPAKSNKNRMNKLSSAERAKVIGCLIEGCSLRSTVRLTGVAKKTVSRILVEVGEACAAYHDRIMRNLPCKVIQVDEVWSFTYCKQANIPEHLQGQDGVGDTWTWIAIDADTKLIPSWHVGLRDLTAAYTFIHDLKGRLANRVQLTSDGHRPYIVAVEDAFGADIDYSMLIKMYGRETGKGEARYSPPVCIGARRRKVIGKEPRFPRSAGRSLFRLPP